MSLLSSAIELLEPRTVMLLGSIIAFGTSGFLAIQAYMSSAYRWVFSVLSMSMALAGTSLGASVVLFDDFTVRYTVFSLLPGLTSYLIGMYSLVLLYRPSFPRPILLLAAGVAFAGFAVWTTSSGARNWNSICQFTFLVATLVVVAKARDDLAPATRWLSMGMCIFATFGFLPRLILIWQTGIDQGPGPILLDTTSYRIRALIWTLSPVVLYAVVTGVVHARIAAKLKRAVDLDVLTGAHSRRYLFERGEELLKRRSSNNTQGLSVLLIDVDHFKAVNDQWGHAVGDEVLRYLVKQVREVVRVSDSVIARYGGEEFVVLVPTPNQAMANHIAERIRSHLKAHPFSASQGLLPITVSIGVAANRSIETLKTLIDQADECLYRAKKAGRDRVVYQSNLLVPV